MSWEMIGLFASTAIYIVLVCCITHKFLILIFGFFLPIATLVDGAISLITNVSTLEDFCIFLIYANGSLKL